MQLLHGIKRNALAYEKLARVPLVTPFILAVSLHLFHSSSSTLTLFPTSARPIFPLSLLLLFPAFLSLQKPSEQSGFTKHVIPIHRM